MDSNDIYAYRFDRLYHVLRNVKDSTLNSRTSDINSGRLISIVDEQYQVHEKIVKWVGNNFQYTIEAIIINLLNLYGISYEKPSILHKDQKRLFLESQILFSLVDSGKRIGYVIGDTPLSLSKLRENWRKAYTTVDYIKIFVLYEKPNLKNEWIDTLINTGNRIECEEDNSYIQFYYLEDLFVSLFGNNEYDKFRVALNRFNEKTKHMIGYETIVTTTEDSIRIFKDKCSLLLRDFDYNTILPSSISDAERKMLRRNYIDNGIYRAMTGNSDFADSFISSEWLYNIHQTTNAIDQTGIVAGYLKSVEQLLFSVISLSKDMGFKISSNKDKYARISFSSSNDTEINTTMGSLVYFIKENKSILDAQVFNSSLHSEITGILDNWTSHMRNGYFHKDNLKDLKKVERIRTDSILLYYLILGGFSIYPNEYSLLGIPADNNNSTPYNKEVLYSRYSNWLSPILLFEIPQNSNIVCLMISPSHEHEVSLCVLRGIKYSDYRWNHGFVYNSAIHENNCTWDTKLSWNDVIELLQEFTIRFMKEGE